MTAMPENVREAMKTQGELIAKATETAFQLQVEATRLAGKQVAASIETTRAAIETQAKATKAMQDSFLSAFAPKAPEAN